MPLVQIRQAQAVVLSQTTDVKALMADNGGRYDIDLDLLWNGEQSRTPAPFAREEIAFYQCDHLGTPQELTDHAGRVAWSASYKAWGEARQAISEAWRRAGFRNPIRFQGQYLDEETGLHYNRHRYFDPQSGRYISHDPIRLAGGINLQEYAFNPLEWIDPLGLAKTGKAGRYHGPKPTYTNPGHHDTTSPDFRGGRKTSRLPCHHEALASRAVPDAEGRHWYAVDNEGVFHRFGNGNDGTMHWNGDSTQNGGFPVPLSVKKRLDSLFKDGRGVKSGCPRS
ncbi:RHS repeat-associated core domain-containing protein [uncultured Variovorax sp.]|uniref:RHS repeat domain-containing protein n=1 Tax=uncultured Variovorax sp. TaxID=114708 RepID=UPI0025EC3B23|nr:RHS repeat-associated core domain-containing protein [uncultured Variovorax sp.]